jgi:hypothetical protein
VGPTTCITGSEHRGDVKDTIAQSDNLPALNGNLRTSRSRQFHFLSRLKDANCFARPKLDSGLVTARIVWDHTRHGHWQVIIDSRVHHGAHCETGEVYRIPLREAPYYFLAGAGIVRGYMGEAGDAGDSAL